MPQWLSFSPPGLKSKCKVYWGACGWTVSCLPLCKTVTFITIIYLRKHKQQLLVHDQVKPQTLCCFEVKRDLNFWHSLNTCLSRSSQCYNRSQSTAEADTRWRAHEAAGNSMYKADWWCLCYKQIEMDEVIPFPPWIATASTPFSRRYSCMASTSAFFSANINTLKTKQEVWLLEEIM